MVNFALTPAIARFPRRYPLSLLVILIPISLLLYYNFGVLQAWSITRIVPVDETESPILDPQPIPSETNPTLSNSNSSILLVSAFYPLSKSKHSMSQYSAWLTLFLARITTDIYFYTTPDMEETIRNIRGPYLPITINTTFPTAFDIPPLVGKEDAYEKMHNWDREKDRHSPELYAIWAAKPFLLAEATRVTQEKEKGYEYAFWVDAGSFREQHAYSAWPDKQRADEIWDTGRRESGSRKENLLLFSIQKLPDVSMLLWKEDMGPIDNDFSEGSFFGGPLKQVFWWERIYYAYHNHYLAQNVFVGKDQSLMNSLFLLRPDHVLAVWHGDPQAPDALYEPKSMSVEDTSGILGDCGNAWYYYQFFVAGENDRDAMRKIWDGRWHWDFWHSEWWTRKRHTCQLTRVLAMEWLLRRPFGEMWRPPVSTIPY